MILNRKNENLLIRKYFCTKFSNFLFVTHKKVHYIINFVQKVQKRHIKQIKNV